MQLVPTIEGLGEVAHRVTLKNLPALASSTRLDELGLDSFDWVAIFAELEVPVRPRQLEQVGTVGELVSLLAKTAAPRG